MRSCSWKPTPCRQPVYGSDVFCPYHRKKKLKLLESPDEYLDETELDMMMGGREHQDGRRLDNYISDERQP